MKTKILAVMALQCFVSAAALAQTVADFHKQYPRAVAYDHGDPKINEFARLVAKAMAVPYFVEQRPNGSAVWLAPKNDKQDVEIQQRISQFTFVTKACGKSELVTPNTPAGTVKSC